VKTCVATWTKVVTVPTAVCSTTVIVPVVVTIIIPEVLIDGVAGKSPGAMNSSTQKFAMGGHGIVELTSDSHSQYIWKIRWLHWGLLTKIGLFFCGKGFVALYSPWQTPQTSWKHSLT